MTDGPMRETRPDALVRAFSSVPIILGISGLISAGGLTYLKFDPTAKIELYSVFDKILESSGVTPVHASPESIDVAIASLGVASVILLGLGLLMRGATITTSKPRTDFEHFSDKELATN